MPSRDVELDLIGRDHTGHATRSAANNLDQLKRKLGKFNTDSGKAGTDSGNSFSRSFYSAAKKFTATARVIGGSWVIALVGVLVTRGMDYINAFVPLAVGALGIIPTLALATWDKPTKKAIDKLKGRLKDFLIEVSKPFKPGLLKALEIIEDKLKDLKAPLKKLFKAIGDALPSLSKGVMDALVALLEAISTDSVREGLKEWGKQLPGIATALGKFIGAILKDPATTVQTIKDVASDLQTLAGAAATIAGGLRWIGAAWHFLSGKIRSSKIGEFLGNVFHGRWKKAGEQLKEWGTKVVTWIRDVAAPWIWEHLKILGAKLVAWIKPRIKPAVEKLKEWGQALWDWIVEKGLPALGKFMGRMGAELVAWIVPRIPGMIRALVKFNVKMTNWILFTGIPMLIVATIKMGIAFVKGFVQGARDANIGGKIRRLIGDMWAAAKGRLNDVITAMKGKGRAVINGLLSGLKEPWQKLKDWVGGIAQWIKDHKGPVSLDAKLLVPAGKALMGGLLTGLKFGFGPVGSFVFGAATKVSDIISKIKASYSSGGVTGPPGTGSRKHVQWHGGTFTERFRNTLVNAQKIAGMYMPVMQGGFRPRTWYSGTSHAGDAIDTLRITALLRGLRSAGVAAWKRGPAQGMINHIHGVPLPGYGYPGGSGIWQAQDYLRGGIGLSAGSGGFDMSLLDGGVHRTGRGNSQVSVEAPIIDTRVFIDGKELHALVRETVIDENKRAAYRAKVGRR